MVKVLLVGNGGREHAMASAICRSGESVSLCAFMGSNNPGIARLAKQNGGESVVGSVLSPESVAKWAESRGVELAVIGPESALEAGVADRLSEKGVRCASPLKSAARLESDKSFCRNLMKKYGVPGQPEFGIFSDGAKAGEMIRRLGGNVAVKPAGLTAGKGVKVSGVHLKNAAEAEAYAREVIANSIGGIRAVLVEEKLEGEEFTLQAFVSGNRIAGMPAVQDHKLAFEGDAGPNTGGMGAYSDANHLLPFVGRGDYDEGLEIMRKAVFALKRETGEYYVGVLYGQFMLTRKGPELIEFNARFGDPEAMNVLSVLESDYVEALERMVDGTVSQKDAKFAGKATVCKYLVPAGYPDSPKKGAPITVDERRIGEAGARLYFGAVHEGPDGRLLTTGSRTAGIVGVADGIGEAEAAAERACSFVRGDVFHRRDIGTAALVARRVEHMARIRGRTG